MHTFSQSEFKKTSAVIAISAKRRTNMMNIYYIYS